MLHEWLIMLIIFWNDGIYRVIHLLKNITGFQFIDSFPINNFYYSYRRHNGLLQQQRHDATLVV